MRSIGLWIIEDTCKNLGIRKVLTIVAHPNNDKALIFPMFITFWILSNFSWKIWEDTTFWFQEKITPNFLTIKPHFKPNGFSADFSFAQSTWFWF